MLSQDSWKLWKLGRTGCGCAMFRGGAAGETGTGEVVGWVNWNRGGGLGSGIYITNEAETCKPVIGGRRVAERIGAVSVRQWRSSNWEYAFCLRRLVFELNPISSLLVGLPRQFL